MYIQWQCYCTKLRLCMNFWHPGPNWLSLKSRCVNISIFFFYHFCCKLTVSYHTFQPFYLTVLIFQWLSWYMFQPFSLAVSMYVPTILPDCPDISMAVLIYVSIIFNGCLDICSYHFPCLSWYMFLSVTLAVLIYVPIIFLGCPDICSYHIQWLSLYMFQSLPLPIYVSIIIIGCPDISSNGYSDMCFKQIPWLPTIFHDWNTVIGMITFTDVKWWILLPVVFDCHVFRIDRFFVSR